MTQHSQTVYANPESQRVGENGGDAKARKGKIWHLPGATSESGYKPNSVFGSYDDVPDMSQPIASFASVLDQQGLPQLKIDYYDDHEEAMREWNDLRVRYGSPHAAMKQLRLSPSIAAVVNTSHIEQTKSLNIMDQILGLQERDFYLKNVVTPIPSNNLVFTIDRFNEGTVQAKVPEMKEAALISHSEERTTKVLFKNVGHIAESEESKLMQLHNTMQHRQNKTVKDMGRVLNNQIKVELETATKTAGSDWGALSSASNGEPDSANNPIKDIETAITKIQGRGFNVDYLIGHDRVITDLATNKFVAGRANTGIAADLLNQSTKIPGLPMVYKDQALTNTIALIGNQSSVWNGQGPTVVAAYEETVAGFSGWLTKQWVYPWVAEPEGIEQITGVSAV